MYGFQQRRVFLTHLTALLLYVQLTHIDAVDDFLCMPRTGDPGQGNICVCNSTYCDTLERPSRLPKGQFYRYSTSNSTPGFTRTTGSFSDAPMANTDDDVVFNINTSVQFQEILGFGGSFTDSVGIALTSLKEETMDNLLKSYFGVSGIEYSMARIPIGGTDFSTSFYSYDDDFPDDFDLEHFNLTVEDYSLKIPFIQRAIELSDRGIRLIGCSWNSPGWMKTTGDHAAGFLSSKHQGTWAKYHIKFLEAYKSEGLDFWAISGGNELLIPLLFMNQVVPMSGMVSTAASQRLWFRNHLVPAVKASPFADIKLLSMDDIRAFAPYWMKRMAADPKTFQYVSGVAVHWYFDFFSPPTILDQLHQKYPDKLILYTESSINSQIFGDGPVVLGSWDRAEAYIYNIMENLDHWSNAYVDWNLALDLSGGPYLIIPVDAAVIVNKTNGEFYKQPMFYGIGHFSKFIPPGSIRVEVKSSQNPLPRISSDPSRNKTWTIVPPVVRCLATVNPDDSRTVMVLNSKNVTAQVLLEDPEQGSISVEVEAKSINTFVYWAH